MEGQEIVEVARREEEHGLGSPISFGELSLAYPCATYLRDAVYEGRAPVPRDSASVRKSPIASQAALAGLRPPDAGH